MSRSIAGAGLRDNYADCAQQWGWCHERREDNCVQFLGREDLVDLRACYLLGSVYVLKDLG